MATHTSVRRAAVQRDYQRLPEDATLEERVALLDKWAHMCIHCDKTINGTERQLTDHEEHCTRRRDD